MGLKLYPAPNINRAMAKNEIHIAPVKSEEDDLEMPLCPYEILSYPADYTLEVLVDKWKQGGIRTPRQQRHYIWKINRASKLIESFLLGLPVPPIFVYQDRDDGSLLIVDGQQRLLSIAYFFSGWFGPKPQPGEKDKRVPFKLAINEKSPFFGVDFDHLKKSDLRSFNRLKDSVLRAFVMKQLNPNDDTSIIEIFERLNTGGMVAQGQEIRNCIFDGPFNDLLIELNKNKNWRKIVGSAIEDTRMRDVELILRFLALFYDIKEYKKPMKEFLNGFMKTNRRPPPDNPEASDAKQKAIATKQKEFPIKMTHYEELFKRTVDAVVLYLGPKPFHVRRGLNAAVFDSVFTAFARHIDNLRMDNPTPSEVNRIGAKFKMLTEDKDYFNFTSSATTDEEIVPKRLNKAYSFLFK